MVWFARRAVGKAGPHGRTALAPGPLCERLCRRKTESALSDATLHLYHPALCAPHPAPCSVQNLGITHLLFAGVTTEVGAFGGFMVSGCSLKGLVHGAAVLGLRASQAQAGGLTGCKRSEALGRFGIRTACLPAVSQCPEAGQKVRAVTP